MSDFVRLGDFYIRKSEVAYIGEPYSAQGVDGCYTEKRFKVYAADGTAIHAASDTLRDKFLADMGLDKL